MGKRRRPDIVHRWEGNPIIGVQDLPFQCSDICNAGAVKIDGEYTLLITIQDLEGSYFIVKAHGADGYNFEIDPKPFLAPSKDPRFALYEEHGVMDARISYLEGQYYIIYNAVGRHGYRLGLAKTDDFTSVERLGIISEPDTKGGAMFPCKINGLYARLERPWDGNSVWISFSDELAFWGESEVVMTPRGGFWDTSRIGAATPPMAIDQGWLCIYYGIKQTSAGPLFRLGAVILDRDDPRNVVGRTNVPILSPREMYERIGDVGNLVFSCGAIVEPNNDVKIYYGAANSCICACETTVQEIVDTCLAAEEEF